MTPSSKCDSCAFNPKGTRGAASEVSNRLKGLICAHGPIPFFCHHTREGPEYDWKGNPLGPMSVPAQQRRLCAGWKAVVRSLARKGMFFAGESREDQQALRAYQRGLAEGATRALDAYLAESDPVAKQERKKELDSYIHAVFQLPEAQGGAR